MPPGRRPSGYTVRTLGRGCCPTQREGEGGRYNLKGSAGGQSQGPAPAAARQERTSAGGVSRAAGTSGVAHSIQIERARRRRHMGSSDGLLCLGRGVRHPRVEVERELTRKRHLEPAQGPQQARQRRGDAARPRHASKMSKAKPRHDQVQEHHHVNGDLAVHHWGGDVWRGARRWASEGRKDQRRRHDPARADGLRVPCGAHAPAVL